MLISRVHRSLATNFTSLAETRDLDATENALLLELDRNSPKYRQFAGLLAIEVYVEEVISLLSGCEPLL